MPVDKYRNCGPDDSEDYRLFEEKPPSDFETDKRKLINETGYRQDKRNWNDLRKIYLKTGTVTSVKGSAYIEVGNTKVLVSVYEPREIPRLAEFCANGELEVEFRYAPFCDPTRRSPMKQTDEKDLGLMLKRALEPAVCRNEFPNCQVDIYALVLDNDGSCFAAAVTAAGVALADAGIPMFDTVAAVTIGIQNDSYFLDPTCEEEMFCNTNYPKNTKQMGLVTLAFLPSIGQISSYTQTGALTTQQILDHIDLLIEKCTQVTDISKLRLSKDVMKKCQEEESSAT